MLDARFYHCFPILSPHGSLQDNNMTRRSHSNHHRPILHNVTLGWFTWNHLNLQNSVTQVDTCGCFFDSLCVLSY